MTTQVTNQVIQQIFAGTVHNHVNGFLAERQSRGLSKHTIKYYGNELRYFGEYLDEIDVVKITEVTSDVIRHYLLDLGKRRNQGGVHSTYRAIKAFLNWTWEEFELEERNPITRVKISNVNSQPLPGITMEDVRKMINACTTVMALRDKTILMSLVDTGIRRAELVTLNTGDVELINGMVKEISPGIYI